MGLNLEILAAVDGDAIDKVRQNSIYIGTLHNALSPQYRSTAIPSWPFRLS